MTSLNYSLEEWHSSLSQFPSNRMDAAVSRDFEMSFKPSSFLSQFVIPASRYRHSIKSGS